MLKQVAHVAVGGYYDNQKLRTSSMNRVRDIVRKKNEGIPFDKVEEKKVKRYDKKYKDANLPKLIEEMKTSGKFTDKEYQYLSSVLAVAKKTGDIEQGYSKILEDFVVGEPIWEKYLSKVHGIGPVLASGLVALIDISLAKHVSSLWKFSGYHVVDGHSVKRKRGEKFDYNPHMRVLGWKISDSFIKQRTMPYREIYDDTKKVEIERLKKSDGDKKGWKLHADLRARRKMVKRFLQDLWVVWRKIEGLPVTDPYSGRFHKGE